MGNEADYSVGRRVYNGASNAPTRGTVDPMGYVERGLNNPSQKRSGLAEAALRALGGGQQNGPGAPQDGPPGGQPPMPGGVPGAPMTGMDLEDPSIDGGVPVGPPLIITATGKLRLNPQLLASMGGMQNGGL